MVALAIPIKFIFTSPDDSLVFLVNTRQRHNVTIVMLKPLICQILASKFLEMRLSQVA